jgi:hypothetical protein
VSRYKFKASHIFIPGNKFYALQWRGPDLSPVRKLSWKQEQKAKTMTSLLILTGVVSKSAVFIIVMQDLS